MIWYEFFDLIGRKQFFKNESVFSYHKMVNVKYCWVQTINELIWFNHWFIILAQLLTIPKKDNN